MLEEGEACLPVHLAHNPFRLGVHALGSAVVERQGHGGFDGVFVQVQATGEGV